MIYSVWNPSSRSYDYYRTNQQSSTHATAPTPPIAANALGATVDQAAWALPSGAEKFGSGTIAKGRIATSSPLASIRDVLPIVVGGVLAYYLFWRT